MAKKSANGEGTIRKRSDGLWEARYTINYKTKSIYGKTQEEAIRKRTKILSEIESGMYADDKGVTVGKWLNTWLHEYKKGNVKQSTFQVYEMFVRCHLIPALGKIKLRSLTVDHVQLLVNEKSKEGLSRRTVQYMKTTLHNALNQAMLNGIISRNVAQAVKFSNKKAKERRILSTQEQKAVIKALEGESMGFLVLFDMFTGLRCGELLGLRWCDVDFSKNAITIRQTVQRVYGEDGKTHITYNTPKTKSSSRTIPLLLEIALKLRAHRVKQARARELAGNAWENNDLVFCSELGKPHDATNVLRFLRKLADRTGIPRFTTHTLRHVFATRSLELGIPLKVVSDMLGHSSIRLTADIYSHVSLEHIESEFLYLQGFKDCIRLQKFLDML